MAPKMVAVTFGIGLVETAIEFGDEDDDQADDGERDRERDEGAHDQQAADGEADAFERADACRLGQPVEFALREQPDQQHQPAEEPPPEVDQPHDQRGPNEGRQDALREVAHKVRDVIRGLGRRSGWTGASGFARMAFALSDHAAPITSSPGRRRRARRNGWRRAQSRASPRRPCGRPRCRGPHRARPRSVPHP